jgi:hypothetical protein
MKAAGSEVERQLLWCPKTVAFVNASHEQCSASGITIFFMSLILLHELSNRLLNPTYFYYTLFYIPDPVLEYARVLFGLLMYESQAPHPSSIAFPCATSSLMSSFLT